jgi:hypothetical protein
MDPINPLNGLAELLRKRVAAELAGKAEARVPVQQKGTESSSIGRPGVDTLRRRISDDIRRLDPDDPARRKKALRLLVEGALTWQFGSAVLNDPRFAELVSEVQQTLETDPGVSDLLIAAIPDWSPPTE